MVGLVSFLSIECTSGVQPLRPPPFAVLLCHVPVFHATWKIFRLTLEPLEGASTHTRVRGPPTHGAIFRCMPSSNRSHSLERTSSSWRSRLDTVTMHQREIDNTLAGWDRWWRYWNWLFQALYRWWCGHSEPRLPRDVPPDSESNAHMAAE